MIYYFSPAGLHRVFNAVQSISIWALLTISSEHRQFLMNSSKSIEGISEIDCPTLRDFREGMDRSHPLSIRIGRRAMQIRLALAPDGIFPA